MAEKITLAGTGSQVMVDFIPMTEAMLDVITHLETIPKIGENSLLGIGHLTEEEAKVGIDLIHVIEIQTIGLDTLPETFHIGNRIVALTPQKE